MCTTPDDAGWPDIYRRHGQLERRWAVRDAPDPVARQFFQRIVHGQLSRSGAASEFSSFGLEPPPAEVLDEAFFLQRAIYPTDRRRPEGRHPDDPLENVYAAALSMLPHGFWVESPDGAQLYRGQRDVKWPTKPRLFRQEDVPRTLNDLGRAVPRVRACLPGISEEQAVAVAQHYSKELGVATWLLDLTHDPRVALFFASDDGVSGDIGVVTCVVQRTWNALSAGGTNRLGRLRVIDVPGVSRIQQQRAAFLDTSHPDLFDQYVADSVWFRQRSGLRFEDPDTPFPVTAQSVYPAADPLLDALRRAPMPAVGELQIGPAGDAGEPLDSAAYLEIALSWCQQEGVEIDVYREDTLKVVCDVHARMQSLRDRFALPDRSLARLQHAVELLIDAQRNGRPISPQEALRFSLSGRPGGADALLQDIIDDCARRRDLC